MNFRKLKPEEIDARIGTQTQKKVSLLLYKDARVDMKLLDEVVGQNNWKRTHELINGNLFCTVSIWDADKKEWVSKQDVGTESFTEKEKGQASDAFKRACFNIGIGRELYTAPDIWIDLTSEDTYESQGKTKVSQRFSVKEIGYNDDGDINQLTITDRKGNVRYSYGKGAKKVVTPKSTEKPKGEIIILADILNHATDAAHKGKVEFLEECSRTIKKVKGTDMEKTYVQHITNLSNSYGYKTKN